MSNDLQPEPEEQTNGGGIRQDSSRKRWFDASSFKKPAAWNSSLSSAETASPLIVFLISKSVDVE